MALVVRALPDNTFMLVFIDSGTLDFKFDYKIVTKKNPNYLSGLDRDFTVITSKA